MFESYQKPTAPDYKAVVLIATLSTLATGATGSLSAADFAAYRGFQFGSTVATAVTQAAGKPSDVKMIHQRPALIQELEWRPGYRYSTGGSKLDPVRECLLRFYNGELFQIVTTYDRQKVEGMSEADLIQALSTNYGPATRPVEEVTLHSHYGEAAPVIARWENADYAYSLVRTGDQSGFAIVMSSKRLETPARASIAEALRLDVLESPQRATALQTKQDRDNRMVLDKARSVNLPNFRP